MDYKAELLKLLENTDDWESLKTKLEHIYNTSLQSDSRKISHDKAEKLRLQENCLNIFQSIFLSAIHCINTNTKMSGFLTKSLLV